MGYLKSPRYGVCLMLLVCLAALPSKYAFAQDDFQGGVLHMFTIVGGPSDGSTVSAATLTALGIAVPDRQGAQP